MINIPIWFFTILCILALMGILFLIIIIISVVIHNVENDLEYRKAVELANKCPEKVEGNNGKEE